MHLAPVNSVHRWKTPNVSSDSSSRVETLHADPETKSITPFRRGSDTEEFRNHNRSVARDGNGSPEIDLSKQNGLLSDMIGKLRSNSLSRGIDDFSPIHTPEAPELTTFNDSRVNEVGTLSR